jgi:hypothetical protein
MGFHVNFLKICFKLLEFLNCSHSEDFALCNLNRAAVGLRTDKSCPPITANQFMVKAGEIVILAGSTSS